MKKYLVFAIAAVSALASCTKANTIEMPDVEIGFQVANYLATKADANTTAFPTTENFGTYAWFKGEGVTGAQTYMSNEKIGYVTSVWKAVDRVYYWPKTGSLDFVSYAPFAATPWCTIAANQITATNPVIKGDSDFLYSDKAVGYTQNTTNTKPGYFEGVPTLFRHALAKLSVTLRAVPASAQEKLCYDEATKSLYNAETVAAATVRWEIKVEELKFEKMAATGTLELNVAATSETTPHVEGWTKPTNAVWSTSAYASIINLDKTANTIGTSKDITATTPYIVTTTTEKLLNEYTVVPQALADDTQCLSYKIRIIAYNKSKTSDALDNKFSEEVLTSSINLKNGMGSTAPANLAMNTKTVYNITVTPSANEIHFDPGVEKWADPVQEGSANISQN